MHGKSFSFKDQIDAGLLRKIFALLARSLACRLGRSRSQQGLDVRKVMELLRLFAFRWNRRLERIRLEKGRLRFGAETPSPGSEAAGDVAKVTILCGPQRGNMAALLENRGSRRIGQVA